MSTKARSDRIIDFHTHVFPPEIVRGRESFARRDAAFGLLYGNPRSSMATVEELMAAMDRDGVEQSVIFGFPWSDPGILREANAYLLEARRRYSSRVAPFYTPSLVPAKSGLAEMEKALDAGMAGVGEVAFYTTGLGKRNWKFLGSLAGAVRERGMPLVLHVNEPVGHAYPGKMEIRLSDLGRFIAENRETVLVLAHWGGGLFVYELMKSFRKHTVNVYYDTAASPYLYTPQVYKVAVDILGPERILFGTDFPLIGAARYFRELEESGLDPKSRAAILGMNAVRLLS